MVAYRKVEFIRIGASVTSRVSWAWALWGMTLVLCSCITQTPQVASEITDSSSWERYEFSRPEMGVPFRVVVYSTNTVSVSNAVRQAFGRIRELNGIFSDYETDSELSRLCQTSGSGRFVPVTRDLWNVLNHSQELAQKTAGAFDVTVGPCSGLWRKARREESLPDPRRLQRALERTGWEKLVLSPDKQSVSLEVPYMQLDLGGIAKGYALDAAFQIMVDRGFPRCLLSGGGDMVMGDPPPGREGWRVLVGNPDSKEGTEEMFIEISRSALATSGDLYQFLEIDGVRYSHIVDPRTCLGLTHRNQVTVIAPNGMHADSLATSLSVLPLEDGMELLNDYQGAEAYVIQLKTGRRDVQTSPGMQKYLEESTER